MANVIVLNLVLKNSVGGKVWSKVTFFQADGSFNRDFTLMVVLYLYLRSI